MADEKKVDLQKTVDCYQTLEQSLFVAYEANAQTMKCIDEQARAANRAGYGIRSFDLAHLQEPHATIGWHISEAIRISLNTHGASSSVAEDLEIPIPEPETGGR